MRALFVAGESRYLSVTRDEQVQSLDAWPQWLDLTSQRQRNVYIGPRIADPIESSQHAIPIAVRIVQPGGETVWAGALLGVEALDQLYESMAIRDGSLSLISTRGDLLLRVPRVPGGERAINVGQTQLFRQAGDLSREGGFVEGPSPIVARHVAVCVPQSQPAIGSWSQRRATSTRSCSHGAIARAVSSTCSPASPCCSSR